uniref:Uncharacterized protein n=1 Tax=Anguilla anguilla TaxID=7936 RepID=A0A0E9RVU8_ANGAN
MGEFFGYFAEVEESSWSLRPGGCRLAHGLYQ